MHPVMLSDLDPDGGRYLRFDFQVDKADKTAKIDLDVWWQVATV